MAEKEMSEELKKSIYVAGTYNMRFYSLFGQALFADKEDTIKKLIFNDQKSFAEFIHLVHEMVLDASNDKPNVTENDIVFKNYQINDIKISCLELPEVHLECQSKFVAFTYTEGEQPIYYSAELLEDTDELAFCYKNIHDYFFMTNIIFVKSLTMEQFVSAVYTSYSSMNKRKNER